MTNPQIDLATLKQVISLLTPAPIAPIAPLAPIEYTKGSEAFGMAKDIVYLTKSVDSIENKLDRMSVTHVTIESANAHILDDNKIHAEQKEILNDHETRIRSIESSVTKILVWGSVILVVLTTAQVVLRLMGK